MRILITGSNGLLGQKIINQLLKRKVAFLATSLGENRNSLCPAGNYRSLDITNPKDINEVFTFFSPTVVINTAAMTNVDQCEENEEQCRLINVEAVNLLFQAAKGCGAHFVQLSTDFVFDGQKGNYREEDERNPLSIYARSKVDSEDLLITDTYENWTIVRTIIVFGDAENMSRSNIVLWAKGALEGGQPLTIVDDQFRAPTWADDLAWACIQIAKLKAYGMFHISGPETMSIFDLVCRIARFYGYKTDKISPVSSATLNQKAKRPPKTGFLLEKAKKRLGYQPKTLENSLLCLFDPV